MKGVAGFDHWLVYLEEDSFDIAAVFASLVLPSGVEEGPRGEPLVGDSLAATQHPYEDIGQAVLGLTKYESFIK